MTSETLFADFSVSAITALTFGLLLGLKHATEADHLAAVSTIVIERKSLFGSAIVGGIWGVGHTIALLVAGIFVLLLNFQISERTEGILEFCVGVMLVILGVNVLQKIVRGATLHFHTHKHGGHIHAHPHLHEQVDEPNTHHGLSLSPKPLIIGIVHGLAGSAALMLLVLPTIHSRVLGMLYIVVFGIGSIGGMMIMSFILSLPLHFTLSRFNRFNTLLQCLAGGASVCIGLLIIYEKGFARL